MSGGRRWWWTLALALLLGGGSAAGAETDWKAVGAESTALLRDYIRIDTSNPPGNELAAARFLAARFEKEGIESKVYESAPGRGSVLARLPGRGRARPVVLLNHLDVVPAKPEEWQHPPFAAEVHDGYVYGRGAIDCKGPGTVAAMAMIGLRRAGVVLDRDVYFLGTADEEVGGAHGAGWFVEHHLADLGNPEFVLNEGGFINREGARRVYEVSALEKAPCWLRLTAEGPGGHGSTPPSNTAPARLVRALNRLLDYETPVRVLPEVQAYFAARAPLESGARAAAYADLQSALADPAFRSDFLRDPVSAALVRNTIAPTVLSGSHKTNVIPRQASAEVDCRLLPGEDPQAFVRTVREVIGDPQVAVDVLLHFKPVASPLDTALFAAIRAVGEAEGALVVPKMLRGFTDSHFFRAHGITSYGFVPLDVPAEDDARMHGIDERIAVSALGDGVRRLSEILRRLDRGN